MGEDESSFALCRQIVQQKPKSDVFLQCADMRPQSVTSPRLHLFSPEETAARLFWKERCLYSTFTGQGRRLSIVLPGSGALAENLLYYGLLDNIFHPRQMIEYHIFGGCARFAAVHTQLDQIGDSVTIHKEPWWDSLDLLRAAHLVLLLPRRTRQLWPRICCWPSPAPVW